MAFERITVKKIYYYVICAITLFILIWGAVDVISSVLSITVFKGPSVGLEAPSAGQSSVGAEKGMSEPFFDEYYQNRMAVDRIGDSVARILVAGAIFIYASLKVKELEGKDI